MVLLIILTNIILYFRTIFFSIIIDDIQWKKKNIKFEFNLQSLALKLYGAGTFKDERIDHAFTIVLHTIASVLIYVAFGSNYISFLGALLYSIHPANNQTAVWLNGRRYLVNVILVLLIWICKPIGILLYALTPLFQVSAVAAPLLYLLTDYWYVSLTCLIFPLLFGKFIINKFFSRFSDKLKGSEMTRISPQKAILMVKTFGYYFWHIVFPLKVSFYPDFYQTFGITKTGNKETFSIDYKFWFGVLAIVASATLAFFYPFYMFWFVVFILPFCNLVTITQLVADRYTAIASIGLLMAIASALSGHIWLFALLAGMYAVKAFSAQNMYRNIDDFYLYHIYNSPKSILPIIYYSKACIGGGMLYHAYVALRRGLIYQPKDMRLFLMLAKTLKMMGHNGPTVLALNQASEQLSDNIWETQEVLINDIKKVRDGLR